MNQRSTRIVLITGASRGLGLVSAVRLYNAGWNVVAAMRSPEAGLAAIRSATGARPDDPRLTAVRIDLEDVASIQQAAATVVADVGAPDVVVHNAAFVAVGCVEEMPADVIAKIFTTNLLGPIHLTRALLPAMRAAGRGRFVVISSAGGVRGMPVISMYSASKGAIERWAEALAHEIAPFGLGVTILSTGTFRTDVYDENHTTSYADPEGPYAPHHAGMEQTADKIVEVAKPPEHFAAALEKALRSNAPFAKQAVGADARMLLLASRFMPGGLLHSITRRAIGLPRPNSLRARSASVDS